MQMYELVSDIEAYPGFLPWCCGARVLSRENDTVHARLDFSVGSVARSFTTRNHLREGESISMQLEEGPFSELEGYWLFERLGDEGCKVSLDMEFEFSNKLLSMTVGPVFNQVANTLVDAFCKRANDLYG